MPARRRRRAPGSRRGRARGLLDRCTSPMLATSRAAAIECDAVDVAVGDRLQDAFAALAFSRAFEYSAYHHSASRTLTTNRPSVTGVSPDPESSRRASSTTPYCLRLLVEDGLLKLEDYRESGRRAGASGQPRRLHRRRGSSPVASAVRDSGCRKPGEDRRTAHRVGVRRRPWQLRKTGVVLNPDARSCGQSLVASASASHR